MLKTRDIAETITDLLSGVRDERAVENVLANLFDGVPNFWMYADRYKGTNLLVSANQELAFLDVRRKHFRLQRHERREYRVDGGGRIHLYCYLRHPMPGEMLDPILVYTPNGEYVYINMSMKPAVIPEAVANELLMVNAIEKVVR